MINIGIIGAGFVGEIHSEAIRKIKNARMAGVSDIDFERARQLAGKIGSDFYPDIEGLIGDKKIDVIAICVPTHLHAQFAKKAALAGKHIFCEKPISLSVKDSNEMIDYVKKNNLKAMVGHVLRFWPEYIKAKEVIEKGYIGKPLNAFCQRLLRIPSRSKYYLSERFCGGAAIDLQVHDLDYLMYLFGIPEFVASDGIYNKNYGGWIHMDTSIRFKNGVYGVVDDGWSIKGEYPFKSSLRIIGDEGCLELLISIDKNVSKKMANFPLLYYSSKNEKTTIIKTVNGDPYYNEWKYFINCIQNNKKIDNSTFIDGKRALEVALATIRSAKESKVVKLRIS